ncbi:sigma-70 family RNA polymerase sigma factor [Calidifontibacillus erzurumensis]|uniref:sigma-70 family RNA polymerase sigma factor n=1 Tax=Calidifontibacillus erzurumensis TaxID=2741433 RepID=UPI0035B522EA
MGIHHMSIEDVLVNYEPLVKKQIQALGIYKNKEDFYQLGMIGLWEAYIRFDEKQGTFPAFAKRTVRGKMLTQLSKDVQLEMGLVAFTEEMEEVIADTRIDDPLERELVLSYCHGLSEKQLTWVIQSIIENKKLKEIAEDEGVSVERVKSWRKRALKKILKNYEKIHGQSFL